MAHQTGSHGSSSSSQGNTANTHSRPQQEAKLVPGRVYHSIPPTHSEYGRFEANKPWYPATSTASTPQQENASSTLSRPQQEAKLVPGRVYYTMPPTHSEYSRWKKGEPWYPASVKSDDETSYANISSRAHGVPAAAVTVEEQRRIAVRNKQIMHYGLGLITVLVLLAAFIGVWRLIKKSRGAKKTAAHDLEFSGPASYGSEKTSIPPMTGPVLKEKDITPASETAGSGAASYAQAAPSIYGTFGHAAKS